MDRLDLRFDAPIYYLYCHALELTMKAFLRAKGIAARELANRKYGHQLLALWQACLDNGFQSPSLSTDYATEQVIEILDPYAREFEFRYIKVGAKALPSLDDVKLAAGRLLGTVKPSIPMPPKAA